MKQSPLFRLVGLCAVFALLCSAQAQTILTVTNTNDNGAGSLRATIATANEIDPAEPVVIDLGVLQFLGDPVIELSASIGVNRPMDILNNDAAAPVTLRMVGSSRHLILFTDVPGSFTIAGIRFEDGRQPANTNSTGGAIFFNPSNPNTLNIIGCSFVGNTAGEDVAFTNRDGLGGAIYMVFSGSASLDNTSLVVRNSVFHNNHAFSYNNGVSIRAGRGGAIFTRRVNVLIEDSVFTDNSSTAESVFYAGGGALALESPGTVTILRSSFSGNKGGLGASTVWVGAQATNNTPAAVVTIADSVFHHNGTSTGTAAIVGGGRPDAGSSLLLRNTTLSRNLGADCSTILLSEGFGPLELVHSTVTRNHSGNSTAAIRLLGSGNSLTLSRSIVAGNTQTNPNSPSSSDIQLLRIPDVFPDFVSTGYNVVGSADGANTVNADVLITGLSNAGDVFGSNASPFDPGLAELADYGGPTLTAPPLPTGPLVDAIPGAANVLAADQRQISRPQGTASDIGAVELPRVAFTTWNLQIPNSGQRGATADPDDDDKPNSLEYYLGTNPTLPSVAPVRMVSDETGDFLEVIRSASVRPAFFTLERVETSPSLNVSDWSPLNIRPIVTPETPGSIERMRFRYPLVLGAEPARFYRVRVQ